MAFCIALAMILFTAGIDKKYIIGAIIIAGISIPILYNFVLPEHAKKRIDIFLNPDVAASSAEPSKKSPSKTFEQNTKNMPLTLFYEFLRSK